MDQGKPPRRGLAVTTTERHLLRGSAARTQQAPDHEDDDQTEGNVGRFGARSGDRATALFRRVDDVAADLGEIAVTVEIEVERLARGEEDRAEFVRLIERVDQLSQLDFVGTHVDHSPVAFPEGFGDGRVVVRVLERQSRTERTEQQAAELELHVRALVDTDETVAFAAAVDPGFCWIRDRNVQVGGGGLGVEHAVGGESVPADTAHLVLTCVEVDHHTGNRLTRDFEFAAGDTVSRDLGEFTDV